MDCSPHLFEDKLGLEGLALPLGAPYSHDQRHLYFACKTAFLDHVVLCDVELQHRPCCEENLRGYICPKDSELQLAASEA